MAALFWQLKGYGYEITSADVIAAYEATMEAACAAGQQEVARDKIGKAVNFGLSEKNNIAKILARYF